MENPALQIYFLNPPTRIFSGRNCLQKSRRWPNRRNPWDSHQFTKKAIPGHLGGGEGVMRQPPDIITIVRYPSDPLQTRSPGSTVRPPIAAWDRVCHVAAVTHISTPSPSEVRQLGPTHEGGGLDLNQTGAVWVWGANKHLRPPRIPGPDSEVPL